MSDENDDRLLEEDGDYNFDDLGEGDEEALLADDDTEEFGEEPEDVLELEAGQDELDETEIQDAAYEQVQQTREHQQSESHPSLLRNNDIDYAEEESPSHEFRQDSSQQEDETPSSYGGGEEEDEEEEEEEDSIGAEGTRGRFRSERNSSVTLKSNSQSFGEIPDTLDQIIPDESTKSMQGISRIQRGGNWGRNRGGRGNSRGNMSNFRGGPTNRGQMQNQMRGRGQHHGPGMGRNQWSNFNNQGPRPNMMNVNLNIGPHPGRPNMGPGPNMSHNPSVSHNPNVASIGPGPNMRGFAQNFGPGQGPLMGAPMAHPMGHPNMGPNGGPNMGSPMMGPPNVGPNINQHNVGHPNMGQPNMGQPNMGQPNMGQPNMGQPNMGQSNMGQPNMGQSNMGQSNMGQPNMGQPNMGQPNMGQPNMGPPNMGQPNMGPPNMGPPNMGPPSMGPPNMGPLNMGPHNMGPPNMVSNMGPHMGHPNLGPSIGHHNMVNPNMGHQNMSHPNMTNANMGPPPNLGPGPPNMIHHNLGSPNIGPPFMGHSNAGPNVNPNLSPNLGPNMNHSINTMGQGFRSGNFTFQNDQYTPIQRTIFNPQLAPSEETRPNQVTKNIHINPHFRGNVHGSIEGRTVWENNTDTTQYQQGPPGQYPVNSNSHREGNYGQSSSSDWNQNAQNFIQKMQGPFQPQGSHQQHSQFRQQKQPHLPQPQRQQPIQQQKPAQQQQFQNSPGRGGMKGQSPGSAGDRRKQQFSPPKRSQASSPGVIPRKQVRLEPKHAKAHNSNLHEVPTVDTLPVTIDTLPDTTTANDSQQEDLDEDEETREYRKKIEEQKRLREKLLREKEERRRKAALEKQKETDPSVLGDSKDGNTKGHAARDIITDANPCAPVQSISTIVNRNQPQPSNQSPRNQPLNQPLQPVSQVCGQPVGRPNSTAGPVISQRGRGVGRGRGISGSPARGGRGAPVHARLGRGGRTAPSPSAAPTTSLVTPASSPVKIQSQAAPSTSVAVTPLDQGTVQRGGRIVMLRGAHQQSSTGTQRIVKAPQEIRTIIEPNVINNITESGTATTKTVSVENLANSTNESQLRMMCNCIGRVESIKLDQQRKRAVIRFAAPESASAFVKRYQRKMLDLSLIKVDLVND